VLIHGDTAAVNRNPRPPKIKSVLCIASTSCINSVFDGIFILHCKISTNLQIHWTKTFCRANQNKYFGKVIDRLATIMEVHFNSLNRPFVSCKISRNQNNHSSDILDLQVPFFSFYLLFIYFTTFTVFFQLYLIGRCTVSKFGPSYRQHN